MLTGTPVHPGGSALEWRLGPPLASEPLRPHDGQHAAPLAEDPCRVERPERVQLHLDRLALAGEQAQGTLQLPGGDGWR